MVVLGLNLEPFRSISLELALNSRVSTGNSHSGKLGKQPLTPNQIEFVFWCLSHTPHVSEDTVIIECDGKKFDEDTLTLGGEKIIFKPTQCESIRLHWFAENYENLRKVSYSGAYPILSYSSILLS